MVADLDGVGAEALLLLDNTVGVLATGEEKGGYAGWYTGGDVGDQVFVNNAGAARHMGDEAQR